MQTDFFEQQEQGQVSSASATDRPAIRRVFLYWKVDNAKQSII